MAWQWSLKIQIALAEWKKEEETIMLVNWLDSALATPFLNIWLTHNKHLAQNYHVLLKSIDQKVGTITIPSPYVQHSEKNKMLCVALYVASSSILKLNLGLLTWIPQCLQMATHSKAAHMFSVMFVYSSEVGVSSIPPTSASSQLCF